MKSIWTMGEAIMEIMRDKPDVPHDQPGVYLGPYPSGAPAIMISSAARMGAPAGMIGCVGHDAFGDFLRRRLEACGVDCRYLSRCEGRSTGVAFVMYRADGSRSFIFHIDGSAAVEADITELEQVDFSGIFHVMGCSLTASPSFAEKIQAVADRFVSSGGKLSFDPNIRPELLRGGNLREMIQPILEHCSYLLPGVEELLLLSGRKTVAEAVQMLFENPVLEVIALKNGSRGCTIYTRNGQTSVPACSVTQADATGAGDCFDGAFLAALLQGKPFEQAAAEANAAGALNAAAFGPMEGDISPDTVADLLRRQK